MSVNLDLEAAIANIKRQGTPKRVFHFEHGLETGIIQAICDLHDLCIGLNTSDGHFRLHREIRINQFVGQEFMRVFPGGIIWPGLPSDTTAVPPSVGPIQSWDDFESYEWPRIEYIDFSDVEWFERHLPDNMAMWAMTYLFQQVSNLVGLEPMCLMLYDDRELLRAVVDKVGRFYVDYTEMLCQFSRVGAINIGDDLGHRTGTFIHPDDLRDLFFPWHKRIIETTHNAGKLGFFHICGKVDTIMDDLIDTLEIDAKHSTQDIIEPIQTSKRHWGQRVALLGGVDVDFITRARPEQVKTYTRKILEECVHGGGFALGIGNWVADSIPVENYLAMLTEARYFMQ